MRLRVKNVGILSDSEIEIAGITVVAGENNTGKSTFGKALYSVFSALNNLEERVEYAKRDSAIHAAQLTFAKKIKNLSDENWLDSICSKIGESQLTEGLISDIAKSYPAGSSEEVDTFVKRATEILAMDETVIKKRLILNSFNGEFRNQIQNQLKRNEQSQVDLLIAGNLISVVIDNETIQSTSGLIDLSHTPVYIDDITSNFGSTRFPWFSKLTFNYQHSINLYNLINSKLINNEDDGDYRVIEDILNDLLLRPVQDRINEICHGTLKTVEKDIKFIDDNMPGVQFDLVNVSSGLKTFLILQELIRNGTICENGTVIMDEPEIHLHPKWQVVLAELIVMLQKAMKLHILITSHSPYFVSAIDVFSKKHRVVENNRYYFSTRIGNSVSVEDVTEKIRVIYDSLAAPYQTIQDEANRVEE